MVYYAEEKALEVIGTPFSGSANDVVICRDLHSPIGAQYTLLVIHDRDCAKRLLSILEDSDRDAPQLFHAAHNDVLLYGFPYRERRRFSAFARGQILTPARGESICVNLVMECLSTHFPTPLLYLILTQDNVNISRDDSIYFTPYLDLSPLQDAHREASCTVYCAEMILELLTPLRRKPLSRKPLKSATLLQKKCNTHSYSSFPELYRDIKLTAIPLQKPNLRTRLRGWWQRNKDRFFHLLLGFCVLAFVCALILLISQMIFGDVPLLRLFQRCFETIGTESMN